MTVCWAGLDAAVLPSVSFVTNTLAVNTAPSLSAVPGARELGTIGSLETNVACTLSIYALASVVAVVQTR